MDTDKKPKCWFRRIRSLKMLRRPTRQQQPDEPKQDTLKKQDSTLRRSLRKWHKRMINCFSKDTELSPTPRSPIREQEELYCDIADNFQISGQTPQSPTMSQTSDISCTPRNEISTLAHEVWYWGPVSKQLAENKLDGAPDGSFLVRDSASDRHIFSISFRSVGKTLHTRIERTADGYKVFDQECFRTIKDFIEAAVRISSGESPFCYTKSQGLEPNYPVRLLKPISRYEEVKSLQSLSRFVIRQHINVNDIDKLLLPYTLISFLKEENYFF